MFTRVCVSDCVQTDRQTVSRALLWHHTCLCFVLFWFCGWSFGVAIRLLINALSLVIILLLYTITVQYSTTVGGRLIVGLFGCRGPLIVAFFGQTGPIP